MSKKSLIKSSELCYQLDIKEIQHIENPGIEAANIFKSNTLIRSSIYNLSLYESRFFNFLIAITDIKNIPETEEEFPYKRIDIGFLCDICGLDRRNANYIKDIVKELSKKYIVFEGIGETKNGEIKHEISPYKWIDDWTIDVQQKCLFVRLQKRMGEHLRNLKSNFTVTQLCYYLAFSSRYSAPIFDLCYSYKSLAEKNQNTSGAFFLTMSAEDFRKKFALENKYKTNAAVRDNAIIPALRDINTFTDIRVDLEEKRQGNKIVGFVFIIYSTSDFAHITSEDITISYLRERKKALEEKFAEKSAVKREVQTKKLDQMQKNIKIMENLIHENHKNVDNIRHFKSIKIDSVGGVQMSIFDTEEQDSDS